MAVYAIGDVQGCYAELLKLLDLINFNERHDQLWFTGDLVNRGPKSLQVLRFVKNLADHAVTVLGNHDLHLLALANGVDPHQGKDTVDDVLAAHDRDELVEWLRMRPLLYHDPFLNFALIHAGLPPQWDLEKARSCAAEVQEVLRSGKLRDFLNHMNGNEPDRWVEAITGWDRLRFIVNCFYRLRYCDSEGRVVMGYKGAPGQRPVPYLPLF